MFPRYLLILSLASCVLPVPALAETLQSVIVSYSLSSALNNFSTPSTALGSVDAAKWIISNWEATGGKLDWGDADVSFVPDPAISTSLAKRQNSISTTSAASSRSASTASASTRSSSRSSSLTSSPTAASTSLGGQPPVLRVGYPQGSYSKRTGGAQWTSNFTTLTNRSGAAGGSFERMLLSYDVWFPAGFNWTLGGKLPGLRGGPDRFGCSGGNQTDGTGCFSTRLMWRPNGAGEVYAYIPPTSFLCSTTQTICNSDYGVSLGRGQFGFVTGRWQTIWLLVVLNEVGRANGLIQLYYNGILALSFPQSVLRTSPSISSVTGLFFSTFFGGDDTSWATATQQYTYYRNLQLFAGRGQSDTAGPSVSSGGVSVLSGEYGGDAVWLGIAMAVAVALFAAR